MSTRNLAADAGASDPTPNASPRDRSIPLSVRARIALVRGFLVAWSKAFSMSGLYKLGQFFGTLEYLTDYKRRRRVHTKLRSYFKDEFPASWYRRVTWRYFMRVRCDKMFYTIMDRIPRGKLMNRIKMFGRENLDAAMAKNKGVYVALCHFGAHHVAGLMTALLGYRLIGVRDPKESHVRRYIQNKYRETFPEVAEMKMFHATSFPRAIYRQFRENKIVASLLDVDRRRGDNTRTLPVSIFGETREFLTGPIQIAARCGAPTLQGFIESRKNFYYRLIVTPPLVEPEHVKDENGNIANVLQRYACGVEQFARQHPDHLMNI
ncbi:MAG: lysophospholipid acyltransferase family protein [Phycisphaerae bacterium]|nr:lysophospholipid acyltransferase family protein [Phycisphaerae bacterium]